LTCRFVSAKGWGYAILHRNREAFVHLKKVAKMSENDHKSPSYGTRTGQTTAGHFNCRLFDWYFSNEHGFSV